ncbi:MAG: DNA replication/repair protein RecF [Firmicutes bacterium]|nr:DNA replication/repair protein RecF [Bacillota bacterium]
MHIKTLTVKNFRNHVATQIDLAPTVNVLVGDNAQGKTNLLESIFLACVGRGWRANRDRDLIRFDTDIGIVRAIATKRYGDVTVEIKIPRNGRKTILINGIPVQKMGELMGQINCVFFSPDELRLVKDAPADRRRFMDIDISQIDKSYFYSLLRYNKILAQRNALLKSSTEDISRGLEIWDQQLAKDAVQIIARRIKFLDELKAGVTTTHGFLTNGRETISLSYEGTAIMDEEEFITALSAARERDMRLRTTTIGPHRDDICICIDNKDVRQFASQGQQRTVALSIKLAELDIFEHFTGEKPILLLDDVFSELDDARQTRLLQAIHNCQTVITTTGFCGLSDPNIKIFNIKNGSLFV